MSLSERIREFLRGNDDLLKGDYGGEHPLAGHCYVASQAYHVLSDRETTPETVRIDGVTHWYLRDEEGAVVDLTAEQFDREVPHDEGTPRGFGVPGGAPCSRTATVIDAVTERPWSGRTVCSNSLLRRS